MRVLMVTGSFPPMPCGVGDYTHQLVTALAATPDTTLAVLTSAGAAPARPVDALEVFPVMDRWTLKERARAARVIGDWAPDVVHIQYPTQGYRGGRLPRWLPLMARLKHRAVVQTWHELYQTRKFYIRFMQFIVAGGLVVVRPNYKELLPAPLHWTFWNKEYAFIRNGSPFPRVALSGDDANALRASYLQGQQRLVVFFGFVNPNKRVELLFEIADPATDHIVIAGEVREGRPYQRRIEELAASGPWAGKATITGFLPPAGAGALLAVADAVVLPFEAGSGDWNTSLHAAVMQGAFVITTSHAAQGYDAKRNTFYASVDDAPSMKSALDRYAGTKRLPHPEIDRDEWRDIAAEHRSFYETVLRRR